jgi:hypothetical protein
MHRIFNRRGNEFWGTLSCLMYKTTSDSGRRHTKKAKKANARQNRRLAKKHIADSSEVAA